MAVLRRNRGTREQVAPLFPGFSDVVEIGAGSLATVFRAREAGTDRLVALKLLNVRDVSPRAIESFQRESVALGALSAHPNIVTLYRTFQIADGRPVLVLELCRGTIFDLLRQPGGLSAQGVVSVGIKMAAALETAHRGQILHRDVKPQNILITEFGEPALADFGVAMLQASSQTTAGLFDFTTLHVAPELLEGRPTSPATDVYELASTLYQLIAGQSAFRAYEGESPASVILRILRDPVRPLVTEDVPMALSDLLVTAMSKDQLTRPSSAAEFAGELRQIEQDQGWPSTPFLAPAAASTNGRPAFAPATAPPAAPSAPAPIPRAPALSSPAPTSSVVDDEDRPEQTHLHADLPAATRLIVAVVPTLHDPWNPAGSSAPAPIPAVTPTNRPAPTPAPTPTPRPAPTSAPTPTPAPVPPLAPIPTSNQPVFPISPRAESYLDDTGDVEQIPSDPLDLLRTLGPIRRPDSGRSSAASNHGGTHRPRLVIWSRPSDRTSDSQKRFAAVLGAWFLLALLLAVGGFFLAGIIGIIVTVVIAAGLAAAAGGLVLAVAHLTRAR
ncbi:MAG: Serine/threonine protein kinase [Pseudonocardiales bacterium]|nr:Serine/threonine protein kinase [Pseudonocardiales bacterium]